MYNNNSNTYLKTESFSLTLQLMT